MSRNNDPLGYYRILGVDPSAPVDQIKKAFQANAQEIHPDKNLSANATRKFQQLNEAYQILGDPDSRSKYDANAYVLEGHPTPPGDVAVQPIACCVCGKISAQPRYVIYRQVVSVLFATYRSGWQGVLCAKCGAKRAYKTSGITWLFGWWGIPWGPIYSVHAIVRNMVGEQPAITNFRVLAMQAAHFASEDRMDIARLLADQALEFVPKIAAFNSNHEAQADRDLRELLTAIRQSTAAPSRPLKASWGINSPTFRTQAAAASLVTLVLAGSLISGASHAGAAYRHTPPDDIFDQVASNGGATAANSGATPGAASAEPTNSIAPSGVEERAPFNQPACPPPPTGRIHSLRKRSRDPTAPLTIVTYNGSPNYYVKLVDVNRNAPVLVLFIRAGESVSTQVPLGRYELRLANGGTWYGEAYRFGPLTNYTKADADLTFERKGNEVAGYTLQLQKQFDGNLKETQIAASEF